MGTALGLALGLGFGGYKVPAWLKAWKTYSDTTLTATPASDTAIDLAWTNPVIAGVTLKNVVVEISTDGVVFTTSATLGVVTSTQVTGLTASTLYYFRLAFVGSRGVRTGAGVVASGRTDIIFHDDLNTLTVGRSGLTMTDIIGENDVQILTPTYKGDTINYGRITFPGGADERLFDGGEYTLYIKLRYIGDGVGRIIEFGNNTVAGNTGIGIYTTATGLLIQHSDGTNSIRPSISGMQSVLVAAAGWIEMYITINPTSKIITYRFYKLADGSLLDDSLAFEVDISSFDLTQGDNYSPYLLSREVYTGMIISFCDLKKFRGIKTIAQCRDSAYTDDIQLYYPEIYSGTDVSGNNRHAKIKVQSKLNQHYDSVSTYLLDKGYTLMSEDLFLTSPAHPNSIYIPNNIYGNSIVRPINSIRNAGDNFLNRKEVSGNMQYINLADCKLRFATGSKWDRSNEDIFKDLARGANTYYDVNNPTDWHITELSQTVIRDWVQENQYYSFVKIINNSYDERNVLREIISYDTNKAGQNLEDINKYTGDYISPKSYDKGQLVISWDDGTRTQYSKAMGILMSRGVRSTHYINTSTIGTSNNVLMHWDNLLEMHMSGFDMQCHTHTHARLTELTEAQVLEEYDNVNLTYPLYGVREAKHTAYPYGAMDANVRTWTATKRLTGRRIGGTVPFDASIDKMQIPAYAIDALTEEKLTILKGYMDTARANNTIVSVYGHTVDVSGGISSSMLAAIVDYALTIGLEVVTMSELYDNVLNQ